MNNYLFGGAAIAAIISVWGYVKEFLHKFFSLFIQTVNIYDDELSSSVVGYLLTHYSKMNIHDRAYFRFFVYLNTYGKYGNVSAEDTRKTDIIFYNGWRPLFYKNIKFSKGSEGIKPSTGTSSPKSNEEIFSTFYFLRGTWNIDHIIGEANQDENERYWNCLESNVQKRFSIIHLPSGAEVNRVENNAFWYVNPNTKILKYRKNEIGFKDQEESAMSRLVFPDETMKLINLARKWHKNRKWYESKGLAWKTGWILTGPPGTGKSSLARAIGMELDLPVWVFRLNEMTSSQFVDGFRSIQKATPAIALFEEFDTIFYKRENITHLREVLQKNANNNQQTTVHNKGIDTELSFGTFLNCLDGIERYDGIFSILTCNDLTKVDEALLNRPGRIDRVIELSYLTEENKTELAYKILGDIPHLYEQIVEYIKSTEGEKITPAQFQYHCTTLALNHFMENIN